MKKETKKVSDNEQKSIDNKWYVIDAENVVLGRLSSFLATRLMGKHKTSYTPNIISNDKIVVINAKKIMITGKKMEKKKFWHTGYPGGIKSKTYGEILNSKDPTNLLRDSIRRMLKKGPLSKKQLKNLYIYSNNEHPHLEQNPIKLNLS